MRYFNRQIVNRQIVKLLRILSILLFASCQEETWGVDQYDSDDRGDQIRFEIGLLSTSTRVFTDPHFASTWEEGDEIGIFACTAGTTLAPGGNRINNVKLTYRGGPWIADEALYWPGSGGKLDFYAYYPYNEATTDPTHIAFRVMSDQSTAAGFSKSLLLTAKSDNSGNGWGKGEIVILRFDHAMAMVQLSVDNRRGLLDESGEVSATLHGAKLQKELSLANGYQSSPDGDEVPVNMFRLEQPGDDNYTTQFTFRAFVPGGQQIAERTSMFYIESGGRAFASAPLSAPLDLVPGQVELFRQTPR